jgi:tRNA dimethylallyltransferase
VGPTASGKTALSIALAKQLQCSVISADSRQFYKEMSIGTAKPTEDERQGVKHYFIDSHSIHDEYTSGQFEQDALQIIENEFKHTKHIVLVGGSGLYIDALCKGIDDLPRNAQLREDLNKQFQKNGMAHLQKLLKEKDPVYFSNIDQQNPHRIIRALEIILDSGDKLSDLLQNRTKKREFSIDYFAIHHERSLLYERINQRVIEMIDNGLVEEVKNLQAFRHKQALNTVGYKEVFAFLDQAISYEAMLALIQQNTRRYAKRQITWFKRERSTTWLDGSHPEKWVNTVLKKIQSKPKS